MNGGGRWPAMVGAIGTRKLVPFLHDVLKAPFAIARNLGGFVAVLRKSIVGPQKQNLHRCR